MINHIKILIRTATIYGMLSLVSISCNKDNNMTSPIEPSFSNDTSILFIPENCGLLEIGELTFDFKDSTYHFINPEFSVSLDSINGKNYQLPDSIEFYWKSIVIQEPLNETQEIYLYISNVENPFADCISEREYFELKGDRHLNYCYHPNPDFTGYGSKLCSRMGVHIKTTHPSGGGILFSLAREGSINVINCKDGYFTAEFDNDFFKNGQICNLKIN